jgi:TonB-linked SusC/RagA family outer membrane protein
MPLGYDDEGGIIRSPESEMKQANTAKREWNYNNVNLGATLNILKDWTVDFDYTFSGEDNIVDEGGTRFTALQSWGGAIPKLDRDGNQIYVDNTGSVVDPSSPGAMPAKKLSMVEYTAHGSTPDHVYRRVINGKRQTMNLVTNYSLALKDAHKFKFMAGMNRITYEETYNWSRKKDLIDITNPQFDLAIGQQEASGGFEWDGQLGFFGRVNYSFLDRYLVEANLRYDSTSKFPKDLRWRAFPSFSVGWILSEESWMSWSKDILAFLKLRGSWGVIGDQTVPNTLYTSFLPIGESLWLDYNNERPTYTGIPSAIDANITWQDIETLNLGVDARFLDGQLGVAFDWYQRDTKNMIVPGGDVSLAYGQGAPKGNYGSLQTRGWEIAVDFNHRFANKLGLNVMVTLADAQTKITKYSDTRSVSDWYVGKKFGEIWGYATDRLYQKEDFVFNGDDIVQTYALNGKEVPKGTAGAKIVNKLSDPNGVYQDYLQGGDFVFGPGDVKFNDLNGDGRIDSGSNTVDKPGDRKVVGNSTPRFEYGLRLGVDYKGVDLSVFMQGVGKRDVWGNGFLAIPGYHSSDGAMPETFAKDYWREDRTNAYYPRPFNLAGSNNAYNMVTQSKYLLDMSYFRIKNITLGYSLPMNIINRVKLQKARFYIALENFFTFDNLRGLPIDPEEVQGYSMFNTENYNSGRTGVGTPTFKNVSFGVQLNF